MPGVFQGYISSCDEMVLLSSMETLANIKFMALFFKWGNIILAKDCFWF